MSNNGEVKKEVEKIEINGIKFKIYHYPSYSIAIGNGKKNYLYVDVGELKYVSNVSRTFAIFKLPSTDLIKINRVIVKSIDGKYYAYTRTKQIVINTCRRTIEYAKVNVSKLTDEEKKIVRESIKDDPEKHDKVTVGIDIYYVINARNAIRGLCYEETMDSDLAIFDLTYYALEENISSAIAPAFMTACCEKYGILIAPIVYVD